MFVVPLGACSLFQSDRGANNALFDGADQDAIEKYSDVLAVKPNNLNARVGRGIAYQRAGQSQKAMRDFDRALSIDPHSVAARLHRGELYLEKQMLDQARADADDLLANVTAEHDRLLALSLSARVYEAQGFKDRALNDAEQALSIAARDPELRQEPHYRELVYAAARLSYEQTDFTTALSRLREYFTLTQAARGTLSERDHYLMALLSYLNGAYDDARQNLQYVSADDRRELATALDDQSFFLGAGEVATGKAAEETP
jgi:tetratricopeptide (TPR) repeat protein